MSAACESLTCAEAQQPLDILLRQALAKDADGCIGLRVITNNTGGGAAYLEVTEAAAKAAVDASTLTPGTTYIITLDGTSQGNADDVLSLYALTEQMFDLRGVYLHQTSGEYCDIRCEFTASGLAILQGDMSKTVDLAINTGAETAIDVSSRKMFGNINMADGGSSAVTAITGLTDGQILKVKSDATLLFDLNAAGFNCQQGFVGNMTFDNHDILTLQYNDAETQCEVLDIFAEYTGGAREYVALLTQSSTSAPVATVLKNTLTGDPVWSRTGAGAYLATLSGAFPAGKVIEYNALGLTDTFTEPLYKRLIRSSDNAMELLVSTFDGTASDDKLTGEEIKITVYP